MPGHFEERRQWCGPRSMAWLTSHCPKAWSYARAARAPPCHSGCAPQRLLEPLALCPPDEVNYEKLLASPISHPHQWLVAGISHQIGSQARRAPISAPAGTPAAAISAVGPISAAWASPGVAVA